MATLSELEARLAAQEQRKLTVDDLPLANLIRKIEQLGLDQSTILNPTVDPGVPLVSALPSSPIDGQRIHYLADATNGVVWHLRYRAASASAYKWERIGGGDFFAVVGSGGTDETTALTTYTNLPTVGPTIVVPLAGEYRWSFSIEAFRNDSGVGTDAYISFQMGATAARDVERISNGSGQLVPGSAERNASLAAGDTLQVKYRTSGGTGRFRGQRTLRAWPIRVG